ncbi:MAG: ABC transporter permease [Verrucomicrobiales bacterium]|nr:ABC transporter permease [Verrucomicrobiales bacterium]
METKPHPPMNSGRARMVGRVLQLRDFGVLIAALGIGLVFALLAPAFLSPYNLFNLLRQTSELGIVAMAMTVLIVSGEFDLSVGAIYAVTGVVTGLLFKVAGMNLWAAGALGLSAALLLGAINGMLVTITRVNSFIATLATMMIFRGLAMVLSRGQPVSSFPDQWFFEVLGRARLFGTVPVPILWLLGWGLVMYFLLHRTAYGVRVFATGDNREAADLAGIRTARVKRLNFLLTALAAGVAGLVSLGYLKTVTPTQGTGLELEAIAASVIGGTAMRGGVGSILGTFLGALIMAEVRTGLVLMGTDAYLQDACVGLIIAAAVILNVWLTARRA